MSRRRALPTYPVGIDWGNPITEGLLVAAVPSLLRELVTGRSLAPVSAPIPIETPAGRAGRSNGSSSYYTCDIPRRQITTAFTIMWLGRASGTPGLDTRSFTVASSTDNNPLAMINVSATTASKMRTFWRDDAGNFPASLPDSSAVAFQTAKPKMLALRVSDMGGANTGAATIFIDGAQDVTSAAYTSTTLTVDRVGVGALARATPASFFAGDSVIGLFWARALTDTEIQSVTRNPWALLKRGRKLPRVFSASSGGATAVGQASEADTAHPITANQARAAGLQSEADSALPITARSTLTTGQPSETDSALPIAAAQTITLGLPSETDTAQAVTPSAPGTLGLQQETDTALPMAAGQARTLGLQSEVDSALGITSLQARTLGEPAEVDAALPMTVVVPSVGLGLPSEGDIALPIAVIGASTGAAPDYALPRPVARRKKVTVIHEDDQAEREAEFQALLARVKGQGDTKGRAAAKRAATGPLEASAPAFEPASIPRMPEVTGVPADALRRWMPDLLAAFRVEYRTSYADQLQALARAAAHNQALLEDEEEVAILAALL